MGWSSGNAIMFEIIDSVNETSLKPDEKINLFKKFINIFANADCDTLYEIEGYCKEFDAALDDA